MLLKKAGWKPGLLTTLSINISHSWNIRSVNVHSKKVGCRRQVSYRTSGTRKRLCECVGLVTLKQLASGGRRNVKSIRNVILRWSWSWLKLNKTVFGEEGPTEAYTIWTFVLKRNFWLFANFTVGWYRVRGLWRLQNLQKRAFHEQYVALGTKNLVWLQETKKLRRFENIVIWWFFLNVANVNQILIFQYIFSEMHS